MLGADPVEKFVNDFVLEPVTDLAPGPGSTYPAVLPQHPKRLRHRFFGPPVGGGQISDADSGRPVQAQEDLQPVGIGQLIEPQGPACGVDVGQRRRRTLDLELLRGLVHY